MLDIVNEFKDYFFRLVVVNKIMFFDEITAVIH